ncbi:ZIP family metal transporter [Mycoplasmopsis columbina]|uniref:ZIP family metal transporter n=1 Tax=Mycoplasmopsis columbina TaxID=114881 RepID=UPI000B11C21E|nr:ZIP family metal transporter [Mycoplasmopsis columbina]VEU77089.1 ZIP Zinc transporter [Mycoplasmopsis columbina]
MTFIKSFIEILKNGHANYGIIDWDANNELILAKFYFVLIAAFFILGIPILITLIFPLFKKEKLNKRGTLLVYAFVTGFFIAMALFGFLREALEVSSSSAPSSGYNSNQTFGWNILLVGLGFAVGLGLAYGLRRLVKWISKVKALRNDPQARLFIHSHELAHANDNHNHMEHDIAPDHSAKRVNTKYKVNGKSEDKNKIIALFMILTHRIPAGLIIGYSLNSFFEIGTKLNTLGWAFIISFILHLIPEILIFFYRQREMGISKWKATFWSISSLLFLIPLMYIGIYLGEYINKLWQIRALIQAMVAGIFLFAAIIEFLPEFYHAHHERRLFRLVMIVFFAGLVSCAIILSFHIHGVR